MRVNVLFFGMLRDLAGCPAEEIELPEGSSVGSVFELYAGRFPRLREMAASIVPARNREFVAPAAVLADGDEVAFLPPVSGGSDRHQLAEAGSYFAIVNHSIDTRGVAARILTGSVGAVVTFEGTARNHTAGRRTRCLDYECYAPMALRLMADIGKELLAEFAIERVAIVHRIGRVLIGETSVAIVVAAAHRRPAFEAALEAINRLKKRVPIWKKEHFADGEVWVEGEWDHGVPKASD